MRQNAHAARSTLDGIYDALRCGAPLTLRMQTASLDALRDIRARDGIAAERDYRDKLRFVALSRIGSLLSSGKSTRRSGPTPPAASRGVVEAPAHPMMGKYGTVVWREPGAVFIRFD